MGTNLSRRNEQGNFSWLNQEESPALIVLQESHQGSQHYRGSSQGLLFFDFRLRRGKHVGETESISVTERYDEEEVLEHFRSE